MPLCYDSKRVFLSSNSTIITCTLPCTNDKFIMISKIAISDMRIYADRFIDANATGVKITFAKEISILNCLTRKKSMTGYYNYLWMILNPFKMLLYSFSCNLLDTRRVKIRQIL